MTNRFAVLQDFNNGSLNDTVVTITENDEGSILKTHQIGCTPSPVCRNHVSLPKRRLESQPTSSGFFLKFKS